MVIIVLGIMLSLVIPTFGEITGSDLRRSARHLTGMVRFLHDESEATKAVIRLRFDVSGGHYWAEALTATSDRTAEFKRLPAVVATEGSLSGNTSFKSVTAGSHPDDPFILFTPDGWVEKTFIHLRDGNGKDFTLIVRPLTAETELREGEVGEK
jgi:type II secretory pathway pseudopilin PulG